jgi:hypothetical protein
VIWEGVCKGLFRPARLSDKFSAESGNFRTKEAVSKGRDVCADGSISSRFAIDRSQHRGSLGQEAIRKHFITKLTDADGERLETQHWLRTAYSCRYLGKEQAEKMNESLLEIGRLLNGMIEKSSAFVLCDDRVQEDSSIDEFF